MGRVYHYGLETSNEAYCTVCEEVKPKSEFYKDKTRKSGVTSRCKICEKKRVQARSDYFREYYQKRKASKKNERKVEELSEV